MKRRIIGILAHVDAGKTTLSEALLYKGGAVRSMGRVDNGDAFLDTDQQERARGITIFSKQARLELPQQDLELTLLDTPGHVDFSAEMERTLQVLDLAVLVISAVEGVQPHTKTIWKLLAHYAVPAVIFLNKTDLPTADEAKVMEQIRSELSSSAACFSFCRAQTGNADRQKPSGEGNRTDSGLEDGVSAAGSLSEESMGDSISAAGSLTDGSMEDSISAAGGLTEESMEDIASAEEELMTEYLESGVVSPESIKRMVAERKLFPVVSGAALKAEGVDELLNVISGYSQPKAETEGTSIYCYKISRDEKNVRLAHLRLFGGSLKIKDMLGGEKVNEIRLYSGSRFTALTEAEHGMAVAVPGLSEACPGKWYGEPLPSARPVLEPVLSYAVRYPEEIRREEMLRMLKEIEEELPELKVETDEEHKELRVSLMGAIQTEILTELIRSRYQVAVRFDVGTISYKETILDTVEGVGHFEPLRHYAEVHLKLEPLETGSGLEFACEVSEDLLAKNWQRLILTHLQERKHRGVLTGSPVTDMKITVIGGKAHNKHTEGGDFRQATYRAVRQGLMQARGRLLEPYYEFTLRLPEQYAGKAMTDIDRMGGTSSVSENSGGCVALTGRAPVASMHTYGEEVAAYSKGEGLLTLSSGGYDLCHNEEEVMETLGYDPEADLRNPSASVFCMHGAGTAVPWNEVFSYMHVPPCLDREETEEEIIGYRPRSAGTAELELSIGTDEIDEIINRTSHANERKEFVARKGISAKRLREAREAYHYIPGRQEDMSHAASEGNRKPSVPRKKYTLVDGYNVIFAWKELKELAEENIDSARDKLLDYMRNYQAFIGEELIVVFDAYKVPNRLTDVYDFFNIHVVFTRTSQTADQYIERFANQHGQKYDITVISSDGLVQLITRGDGCRIISSREFETVYRQVTRLE